jgi:hypothetical protein
MAGIKISDLDELSTADATDSDLLVIVDISADKTKKIQYSTLLASNIQLAEKADQIQIASTTDNSFDNFLLFAPNGSGQYDSVYADAGITVNPSTNRIQASGGFAGVADEALVADSANFELTSVNDVVDTFTGLVTGQVLKWNGSAWENQNDNTGDVGQGVIAKLINTKSAGDADASFLIPMVGSVGTDSVEVDNELTYNPNSNTLTTTNFAGNATTATSATVATTATQSRQLATDSVGATGTYYLITREERNPGFDSANTSSALTFDASTATLSATNFSGDGSSISNVAAASATNATNVAITTATNDATFYVHFGNATSGNDGVNVNTSLTYNPADNLLTSNLTYTTSDASQWNGTAPTTVDSALDRLATLVKTLNSGVGA